MNKRFIFVVSWLFLLVIAIGYAQSPHPYEDEIQAFESQDKQQFPPKNGILFTGSSSIRLWDNLTQYFPNQSKKIIQRGFGGSTLADLEYYLDRIVFPYKPRQIVVYSGENDIAEEDASAAETFQRFQRVFGKIRARLPDASFVYISIKPSPSRADKMDVVQQANRQIRAFVATQKKAKYIDVYSLMLDETGRPRPDIFISDNLHMNEKGYAIWQQALAPHLR